MELSALSSLLPPGLLGLGGVIPILIGQNPFSEDAKVKPLLATVAVLMIWLVWLCSLILFHIFLFSQYWAILALLVAMICLGALVCDMMKSPVSPAVAPTAEEAAAAGAAARRRTTLLYSGGLLCTTVASSILMAMQGWVVVDVKLDAPPANAYSEVSLRKSGTEDVAVKLPRYKAVLFQNVVRVVITQKDFDDTNVWDYICLISKPDANEKKTDFYLERSRISQVIMPGAGVFMEGVPSSTKPVK